MWLYFAINRLVFLLYNVEDFSFKDILESSLYGFVLDVSIIGYFVGIPLLLIIVQLLFKRQFVYKTLLVYHSLVLLFCTIVHLIDLDLFREWGSKINAQFFVYMRQPSEALNSVGSSPLLLLAFIGLGLLLSFVYLHRYFFGFLNEERMVFRFWYPLPIVLVLGLVFVGIRGGVGTIPNNQSTAYYSSSNDLNNAALNSVWNFFYFVFNGETISYDQFVHFTEEQLDAYELANKVLNADTTKFFNKVKNPNIVFVLLESWGADAVSCLTPGSSLTPSFDALSNEGVLFTQCYATGVRTDKGISAVISGFPAQADASAIMYPEKSLKMPSLLKEFKDYSSLFVYGGDPTFANMKIYMKNMGFHNIKDKSNFAQEEQNSKWGAHDGVVFNRSIKWISDLKEPFFTTILTLSSHEPFEVPMETVIPGKDVPSMFKNSVVYSDKSIGEFMEASAKEDWYDSTIFIFVADHGKEMGVEYPVKFHAGFFRIPLMVYSPLLKEQYKGAKVEQLVSQTDVPSLIMDMLNKKASQEYKFSISPFTAKRDFVQFAYYNGSGVLRNDTIAYYDNLSSWDYAITTSDSIKHKNKELTEKAKIYQQWVMRDFFDLSISK